MKKNKTNHQPYQFKTGDRVCVIGDDEMKEGRVRCVERSTESVEVAWRGRIRTWHKCCDLRHICNGEIR